MTTVLLVRHGETDWNRTGRVQGWAPSTLTDRGRERTRSLAAGLSAAHDVDRVRSSDLRRAVETARLLRGPLDAPVALDDAWRERDFGRLQGLESRTLFEEFPQFALGEVGYAAATERPEGGESLLDVRERVLDGWRALVDDADADETVAVVTHGGPLQLLVGHLCGRDVLAAVLDADHDNCTVTEVAARTPTDADVVREGDAGLR